MDKPNWTKIIVIVIPTMSVFPALIFVLELTRYFCGGALFWLLAAVGVFATLTIDVILMLFVADRWGSEKTFDETIKLFNTLDPISRALLWIGLSVVKRKKQD